MVRQCVRGKSHLIPQVITGKTGKIFFLVTTCMYTQCCIYLIFRVQNLILDILYNYILLLFHLNFSWTLWAVNNAHASFVWEKQLTGASFPGISSLYASHNGQFWYFDDYP